MSIRRIEDPEGEKTVTMPFKIAAGATLTIVMQNIKSICFADLQTRRLRVDADATAGGKK